MSEKLEQVAIALYTLEMDWPGCVSLEQARAVLTSAEAIGEHSGDCTNEAHTCLRCVRDRMLTAARAAIKAMREPTHPMLESGVFATGNHTLRGEVANAYAAMIDKALEAV